MSTPTDPLHDPTDRPVPPPTGSFTPEPATTRVKPADSSASDGRPANGGPAPEVPGYAVLGEIARGGMGVVYAARDLSFGREVAVKTLLPQTSHPEWAAQFDREAVITARLPHPGVPPVHARGTLPDGRPFLAMKLIGGHTLAEVLRRRPDPAADLSRLVAVFEQVCQTVGFAHSKGIIHRDLKPANVMVGAFGEVQVMDWGLAKAAVGAQEAGVSEGASRVAAARSGASETDEAAATHQGSAKGTPAYMAPEQARGEWDKVDARADVFALGGIVCAILTGKPPYTGTGGADVLRKAKAADLDAARAALDACGADTELVALAKRCLSAEPNERPADGKAVADAVAAYRTGVEERARKAEAERAAAAAEAREQRKRRKVQLALTAAIGLLLAGVGAFAWWRDHRQAEFDSEQKAQRAWFEAEQKAEQAAFDRERVEKARQARDRAVNLIAIADQARREYRYDAAQTALREAETLAAELAPEAMPAVRRAQADLALVRALDAVRLKNATTILQSGKPAPHRPNPEEYRAVFEAHGYDVVARPEEAGDRMAASPVRAELVNALIEWFLLTESTSPVNRAVWTAHERADSRLDLSRTPAVSAAVGRLAGTIGVWSLTPASPGALVAVASAKEGVNFTRAPTSVLVALSELDHINKRDGDAVARLREAQVFYPRDFHVAFRLATLYFDTKQYAQAIDAYRAALAIRPDNSTVLNNLGCALLMNRGASDARVVFEESIRLDPQFAPARYHLGQLHQSAHQLDRAAAEYREVIRIAPEFAPARSNLALILEEQGDRAAALAELREAVRIDPALPEAHNNLGKILLAVGEKGEALAEFREAARLDPTEATYLYNLGAALAATGNRAGAVAQYRKALDLDPTFAAARVALARELRAADRDPDAALAEARALIARDPKDAAAHRWLGDALWKKGDAAGAAAAYREVLRLDPRDVESRVNLAVALFTARDDAGALAEFREAIKRDPKHAPAYVGLSRVLMARGDADGAHAALREGVRLAPTAAAPRYALGEFLHVRKDFAGAIAAYRVALRLDPKFAPAYSSLAAALLSQRDADGAVAALKEAIRLDSKLPRVHYHLGMALTVKGDRDGAVAAYREAVRVDPKHAQAHNNLGMVLYDKGDRDGALAAYRAAVRADPRLPQALFNLAFVLREKGDAAGAVETLRELVKIDPKDAEAHQVLGLLLIARGDSRGGLASLKRAVELDPKNVKALDALADFLRRTGDARGAVTYYKQLVELRPKVGAYHNGLGIALCTTGDLDAGMAALQKALELDPDRAETHFNIGNVLFEKKDHDKAIAAYKRAVELNPKFTVAYQNLGNGLRAKGDLDGAAAAYKKGLETSPKNGTLHYALGVTYLGQRKYPEGIASARSAVECAPKMAPAHALLGDLLQRTGDTSGARVALTEAARLDKRWEGMLAKLPPIPVAPPPREVNR